MTDNANNNPESGRTLPAASQRRALMRSVMAGFVALPRDKDLAAAIADMVDAAELAEEEIDDGPGNGRLREGRVLVIAGASGVGKTTSLHRAFSRHSKLAGYAQKNGTSSLASFVAPSPATVKQTGNAALAAIGYEATRDMKENVVWDVLRTQLRRRGIRFLHIDELQHVFQSPNKTEHQKIRDTLKGLMQQPDWPVWLIVSGLPTIADFLQADDQIRRRCTFVRFDPLTFERDAADVGRMIDGLCRKAGLMPDRLFRAEDDPATSDEFVHRLIHASLKQVGVLIEFVQDALLKALTGGDTTLTVGHFEAAYRARTGCEPHLNVFKASKWSEIDVRGALYAKVSEPVDPPKPGRPRRDKRNS